jgi:hypothetical protein
LVYGQGVDETTAVLPNGWRDRLIRYSNVNTNGITGLRLDPSDLLAAKLVAFRAKDVSFVSAVLQAKLVSAQTVSSRLLETPCSESQRSTALKFLERFIV